MTCETTLTGFKCGKGDSITFASPYDSTNPLVTHTWTIDGVQESTLATFQKTYPTITPAGSPHTVVHSGSNVCNGSCSKSATLEIVDLVSPPPPATSSGAPASTAPLIIGGLLVAGILAIVIFKKKK